MKDPLEYLHEDMKTLETTVEAVVGKMSKAKAQLREAKATAKKDTRACQFFGGLFSSCGAREKIHKAARRTGISGKRLKDAAQVMRLALTRVSAKRDQLALARRLARVTTV